ncbi:MAG: carboxymuconolactone decarboxylase family protein [Nitrospinota bacterium]
MGAAHGINAVADGLKVPLPFNDNGIRKPLIPLVDEATAKGKTKEVFGEIQDFYQIDFVPGFYRVMAHDPEYLADQWTYVRASFTDRKLDRLTKEILALAASLTAKSDYGTDFHMRECRRLGLSEKGLLEVAFVVKHFCVDNKISRALLLDSDFDELL